MRKTTHVLLAALLLAHLSCGPSKKRPVEVDVTGIPQVILDSFRRHQPNSFIRGFRQTDAGFRIDYITPLRRREWMLFNAEGDRISDSE